MLLFFALIVFVLLGFDASAQCVIYATFTDSWWPTMPFPAMDANGHYACHSEDPQTLNLLASCVDYNTGANIPINWYFALNYTSYNQCNDCYNTGCHEHERFTDGSQKMLTSIGGLRNPLESPWAISETYESTGDLELDIAKPEASGIVHLTITVMIPPNLRNRYPGWPMWLNPGWYAGSDQWTMYTIIDLGYYVFGLTVLPDSNDYHKASHLHQHTEGHQFYAQPVMVNKLHNLALRINEDYSRTTGEDAKISFNDLSLEYGGIFDENWECGDPGHHQHRLGRSADLNTTRCLIWFDENGHEQYLSSSANVTIRKKDGTCYPTMTVKDWIDMVADQQFDLTDHHNAQGDNRIHLEWE